MGVNTEQIIKALECFHHRILKSKLAEKVTEDEITAIINAIIIIKEQQKELTFCYDKLTELEKECLGLSLHNITLKREKKYLRESLADEREHKEDMAVSELKAKIEELEKGELCKAFTFNKKTIDNIYTEAKADTVKKMQERLKQYIDVGHYREPTEKCFSELDVANIIDRIAKEMLEEQNDNRETL